MLLVSLESLIKYMSYLPQQNNLFVLIKCGDLLKSYWQAFPGKKDNSENMIQSYQSLAIICSIKLNYRADNYISQYVIGYVYYLPKVKRLC